MGYLNGKDSEYIIMQGFGTFKFHKENQRQRVEIKSEYPSPSEENLGKIFLSDIGEFKVNQNYSEESEKVHYFS
jgi:hypothetical protein